MKRWEVDPARADMMGGSRGKRGADFLICFGGTVLACGCAAFFVPPVVTAILMLSQSSVAIPAAQALERPRAECGPRRITRSGRALPDPGHPGGSSAVFLVWSADVRLVPATLGAVGGAHFLPFAWLFRTRVYLVLGVTVAVLPYAIALAARPDVYP